MKSKPKSNPFLEIGWLWMVISAISIFELNRAYGWGIPKNTTEWMGEIFVGLMLITGTVLIAIGRYIRSKE